MYGVIQISSFLSNSFFFFFEIYFYNNLRLDFLRLVTHDTCGCTKLDKNYSGGFDKIEMEISFMILDFLRRPPSLFYISSLFLFVMV